MTAGQRAAGTAPACWRRSRRAARRPPCPTSPSPTSRRPAWTSSRRAADRARGAGDLQARAACSRSISGTSMSTPARRGRRRAAHAAAPDVLLGRAQVLAHDAAPTRTSSARTGRRTADAVRRRLRPDRPQRRRRPRPRARREHRRLLRVPRGGGPARGGRRSVDRSRPTSTSPRSPIRPGRPEARLDQPHVHERRLGRDALDRRGAGRRRASPSTPSVDAVHDQAGAVARGRAGHPGRRRPARASTRSARWCSPSGEPDRAAPDLAPPDRAGGSAGRGDRDRPASRGVRRSRVKSGFTGQLSGVGLRARGSRRQGRRDDRPVDRAVAPTRRAEEAGHEDVHVRRARPARSCSRRAGQRRRRRHEHGPRHVRLPDANDDEAFDLTRAGRLLGERLTSDERVQLPDPEPGRYGVEIVGFATQTPVSTFDLETWVVSTRRPTTSRVTGPPSSQRRAGDRRHGRRVDLSLDWSNVKAKGTYMGVVTYHDGASTGGRPSRQHDRRARQDGRQPDAPAARRTRRGTTPPPTIPPPTWAAGPRSCS